MMKKILTKIKQDLLAKVLGERRFSPSIRAKQRLILGGTTAVILLSGGLYFTSHSDPGSDTPVKATASDPKQVATMTTPLKTVDARDIWVSRIEKKAEEVKEESQELRQENQFLQKRIDVLEELFKTRDQNPAPSPQHEAQNNPIEKASAPSFPAAPTSEVGGEPYDNTVDYNIAKQAQQSHGFSSHAPSQSAPQRKRGSKIAHIGGRASSVAYKTKDLYMPAGTYSKAVIVSGIAASTATNAQGNPQPMMLRLVDNGNLPRGFKGRVKDAVLIGSCYGDISSERAYCRLETLSWVEPEGTTVEKKVEGWVFGEDGRAGLRGEVVDRSTEIARESFGAGLLSAAANFFKMESTRSVYPVSPFGQTGAMSTKEALQGAGASGVGSALDRLADFSIKRAEQMQPVIVIASGRVVDIAFKEGVSLMVEDAEDLKMMNQQKENNPQGEE
jgi:conjugal transfer pilus assembly protein TraB